MSSLFHTRAKRKPPNAPRNNDGAKVPLFKEINDQLGLGTAGPYSRFAPHMLRRYHATQLAEAGMGSDMINLLEGRKVHGVAHQSYIRIKPEVLKKQYIDAAISFAIERREEEDERTENDASQGKLRIRLITQTREEPFTFRHHSDEIKADDATEDT